MTTPLPPSQAEAPSPDPEELAAQQERKKQMKRIMTAVMAGAVILLVLLGAAIYLLQPGTPTDRIRDVFIIAVALETLVIGAALIVLIVQLATLINLLQNEVRPILHAASETIHTLRGTVKFLGESVIEPVVKLNSYLAGLSRMLELMGLKKK